MDKFKSVGCNLGPCQVGVTQDLQKLKMELILKTTELELLILEKIELEKLNSTSVSTPQPSETLIRIQTLEAKIKKQIIDVSNKELIKVIIDKEQAFIRKTQRPDAVWFKSRFRSQPDNMPNLNGFQRLNLLLDRNM